MRSNTGAGNRSAISRLGLTASVVTLATAAAWSPALAQANNHSVKFMAFNIWNVGQDSKMWDPIQKAAGKFVFADAMKELIRNAAPDVFVLPELNNNNKVANGLNLVDAFSQNTIDAMNLVPRKQPAFLPAQKNPDEGGKGNGSIFSTVPFTNLPGDVVRISPGNGFPDTVVNSVHMNYYDEPTNRLKQAKDLNAAAAGTSIPTVILGDFNAGDVSERGLHRAEQQATLFARTIVDTGASTLWKTLAQQYVPQGQETAFTNYFNDMRMVEGNGQAKYRNVITSYFNSHRSEFPGITSISQMTWRQWEEIVAKDMASKGLNFADETYPVAANLPVTMNVLKKQYQLFQLERNRELFQPSRVGDERATWTSDGEDRTNTWVSWDRVTIDHVMMSRPFAKWTEIADTGAYSGNLAKKAQLPNGNSFSDHEPVAQELRWVGPQLQSYDDGGITRTRLVWGSEAYNFEGRNKEFYLTRNNNRNDIYLGQIADADGNPILTGLTLAEKKTLLDCSSKDARFGQAIKEYCIDDHSFIGETLVTDGGTVIVDEDAALGGPAARLRLANGGLRIAGQAMNELNRSVVLEQNGWIDIADAGNALTVDQAISGQGSLTKRGAGTLVLASTNSYTGGTVVEGGVLKAGTASAFVSGTVYAVNAGRLDLNDFDLSMSSLSGRGGILDLGKASLSVDQANNSSFAGVIEGTGGLVKTGKGILVLNGQNTYAGLTQVNGGGMVIGDDGHADARLAGSVSVTAGATLAGRGSIGGLVVANGASVAPGNSIGTLSVTGNLTLAAGSVYELEIDPSGASDRLVASGTATIGGAAVNLTKASGNYEPGRRYTILTADGGVTGSFASLTQDMPFIDLGLAYDPKNVYLDIARNTVAFPTVGTTANQQAAAAATQALGGGNPVYDAVVWQTSAQEARAAFEQLSGEVHASGATALINSSQYVRNAANDRVRAAFGDVAAASLPVMAYGPDGKDIEAATTARTAAWGQVFGAWSSIDGDGNASRMKQSTGGFITGIDTELAEAWRVGVLAGYSRTSFDAKDRSSSGDSNNYHLGLYGGTRWGALALRTGLSYTWSNIETGRTVSFRGFNDGLSADYDAGAFQAFGELGYRLDAAGAAFEPFVNLAHVSLHTDGFTEKGGAAALSAEAQTTNTTFSTLGLRASTDFMLGSVAASANGTVGWKHAFGDTTPFSKVGFAGSSLFTVTGVPIARNTFVLQTGLDMKVTDNATLGISYNGEFGSGSSTNGVDARLSVKF
jgi:subtilase-type serine protease